jgi:hypothetical protein
MLKIIPVKPGTITPAERDRLQAHGVIVVEHASPEELIPLLSEADDCCLESLVAKLVGAVVSQVGPDYVVTVKGSVKTEPLARMSTGNGPPANIDNCQEHTVEGTSWSFTNNHKKKWWVFALGSGFSPSPQPAVAYNLTTLSWLSPAVGIAYLLDPQQSITLTWSSTSTPPAILTRAIQAGE